MIRAILALLFAVCYLILGIPVLIVEWIIRKFNKHAADISSLRMVQWAFRQPRHLVCKGRHRRSVCDHTKRRAPHSRLL